MIPPTTLVRSDRSGSRSAMAALRKVNLELNRRFHLYLQDTDPVEVYCRVRPLQNDESCVRILDDASLAIIPPESSVTWKLGTAKEQHYAFQRVFGCDASQKLIFDDIALPLVKDFLQGKNALLFAYGVTGSGKTFTMSGNALESGVMPRCLDVVFNSISKRRATKYVFKPDRMNGFITQCKADALLDRQKEMHGGQRETAKTPRRKCVCEFCNGRAQPPEYGLDQYLNRVKDETTLPIGNEDALYSVFVTYVEIYNNSVYDLLDESPIDMMNARGAIQHKLLREDVSHNVYVNGVAEVEVESPEEAFEVYLRGQRRRRMAHTALNTESSRSHSIFNIRLVQAPTDSEGEEVVNSNRFISVSQLSLVDLAGSERYRRTQSTGDRLKEAGNINNSLMTLRKCMHILRENQKFSANRVVPYRDSKLTHFLKNYFDGEGRVRMILCINPKNDDYDENLHVTTFAELTQEVQIVRLQKKNLDRITLGMAKSKRKLMQLPASDAQMAFGLDVPIPICKITRPNKPDVLTTLRKALELRAKAKAGLANYTSKQSQSFRLRMHNMERELETLRSEIANYKSHADRLNGEKGKLNYLFQKALIEKNKIQEEQEKKIRTLTEELLKCRMRMHQREIKHHKEKETLKSNLNLQRKFELKLQQGKTKLMAESKTKDKGIKSVLELVTDKQRTGTTNTRRVAFLELSTTSSESDLPSALMSEARSKFMSTPALYPEPSQNELATTRVCVQHTAVCKPQTELKSGMKNKKSVSKLNSVDDMKGASKYCLLTQAPDFDGDMRSKLYEGEITATITDSANVMDVEVLRNPSPGDSPCRKRRSESPGPVPRRRSYE